MKPKQIPVGRSGLTVFEMLIVVIIVALVTAVVVLPELARRKSLSAFVSCDNNLKAVGLSFRTYASDQNDRYPSKVPEADGGAKQAALDGNLARIFQVMSNELSVPKTVICPADQRIAATNWNRLGVAQLSYFVGLDAVDTRPNIFMLGDRDLAEGGRLLSGTVNLTTNRPVVWHKLLHKEGGNVVLADGSVQQSTTKLLRRLLANTGDATNRVLFPQ